ncbi:hypothetical protein CANMA_004039 [Candida margitis]|uniref:uncharacterized protein n=1 Tax=Candida margitis TaxID=1775924 RepID=UPI002225BDF4|nr:uncharacterized protein CANMA_004039 [Candida margitis]KAI5960259.1 hypothetical protein CANMA_004039 [Candida margitis]
MVSVFAKRERNRGPYHFDTEEEERDFDSMVDYMCQNSSNIICHDPVLDKKFRFTPWGEKGDTYAIAIEFLESGGYSQEQIDEAVKRAKAKRRKPI